MVMGFGTSKDNGAPAISLTGYWAGTDKIAANVNENHASVPFYDIRLAVTINGSVVGTIMPTNLIGATYHEDIWSANNEHYQIAIDDQNQDGLLGSGDHIEIEYPSALSSGTTYGFYLIYLLNGATMSSVSIAI